MYKNYIVRYICNRHTFVWGIVFDVKYDGKNGNRWNLKGFANMDMRLWLDFVCVIVSPSIFNFHFDKLRCVLYGIPTGSCLVKISEGPTVLAGRVGRDDTTFTLCSVSPHDFFKIKCTAVCVKYGDTTRLKSVLRQTRSAQLHVMNIM